MHQREVMDHNHAVSQMLHEHSIYLDEQAARRLPAATLRRILAEVQLRDELFKSCCVCGIEFGDKQFFEVPGSKERCCGSCWDRNWGDERPGGDDTAWHDDERPDESEGGIF